MENTAPPTTEKQEHKRWSKEDIGKASDLNEVMEAYHETRKQSYSPYELQSLVAERLNQIGEEEKGFQFTVLAEQSRIQQRSESVLQQGQDLARENGRIPGALAEVIDAKIREFKKLPEELYNALAPFGKSVESIKSAASSMDTSAKTMSEASMRVNR